MENRFSRRCVRSGLVKTPASDTLATHNVRIMPHRARCNVILGVQWEFGDRFFGAGRASTAHYLSTARDTEQIKIKPESVDPITLDAWPNDDGSQANAIRNRYS